MGWPLIRLIQDVLADLRHVDPRHSESRFADRIAELNQGGPANYNQNQMDPMCGIAKQVSACFS